MRTSNEYVLPCPQCPLQWVRVPAIDRARRAPLKKLSFGQDLYIGELQTVLIQHVTRRKSSHVTLLCDANSSKLQFCIQAGIAKTCRTHGTRVTPATRGLFQAIEGAFSVSFLFLAERRSKFHPLRGTPASRQNGQIGSVLIPVKDGRPERLVWSPVSDGAYCYPNASPTGTALAYTRYERSRSNCDLYWQALGGDRKLKGEAQRLTTLYGISYGLTWMRDGKSIIYASGVMSTSSLWRVPLSGEPPSSEMTGTSGSSHRQERSNLSCPRRSMNETRKSHLTANSSSSSRVGWTAKSSGDIDGRHPRLLTEGT